MSIISRKPSEKIKYKYKLNNNYKKKDKVASLNGVVVRKDIWSIFDVSQEDKLKQYIKTYKNPNGIVDEFIEDPLKEFATDNGNFEFKHKRKIYSREVLVTFTRPELEEICREYNIETVNKANNFLIKRVLEEQKIYRDSFNSPEDFFDSYNKILGEEED